MYYPVIYLMNTYILNLFVPIVLRYPLSKNWYPLSACCVLVISSLLRIERDTIFFFVFNLIWVKFCSWCCCDHGLFVGWVSYEEELRKIAIVIEAVAKEKNKKNLKDMIVWNRSLVRECLQYYCFFMFLHFTRIIEK